MPKVYDDWERLVRATIRREEIWQLCHEHSRTPSGGSTTSGSNSPKSSRNRVSPLNDQGGAGQEAEVVPPRQPVLVGSGSGLNRESTSLDVSRTPNRSGNELKKEKLIRRSKSRLRLDRWIWKRWISKAF